MVSAMPFRLRYLASVTLLLALANLMASSLVAAPQPEVAIYGKVADANTGLPIPNATVLVWDLYSLDTPKVGAGIYFTDNNGEYRISGPYVGRERWYRLYAYKGDFGSRSIDYAPSPKVDLFVEFPEGAQVSFLLVPGALIELEGIPYLVRSSSPGAQSLRVKVLSEQKLNAPFLDTYYDSEHRWFLGLDRQCVIVPANTPVTLEAQTYFYARERGRIEVESFRLYNDSLPFFLLQGHRATSQLSAYSLRGGLRYVEAQFVVVSRTVNAAQGVGFVVFDERRSLTAANQRILEAGADLTRAKEDRDYLEVWNTLRDVLGIMRVVSLALDRMRLIAMTSAGYLAAIMAAFSAVLAFFFFEEKRRKLFASVAIYAIFLVSLYFTYPGAHIVIDENVLLFLQSAGISFLGVSAIIFGLPRVWRERLIEGEVSWRSAIALIFSMGKREIRRRKIRGFFTILSVIILILAFTSLTSFGTAYGIISDRLTATAPSDGIIVKRMLNETSLLFSPLGASDAKVLSRIIDIRNIAVRLKNIPSPNPVVRLSDPKTGKTWFIYGVLGVTPAAESMYTNLDEAVEGSYLGETEIGEVLLCRAIADTLGVSTGQNVSAEILGTRVSTSFIIKGVINDDRYLSLVDVDGSPLGPSRLLPDGSVRRCNNTETMVISWNTAEALQGVIASRHPEGAPEFAVISEIVFQPGAAVDVDSMVRTLIYGWEFDVFVVANRIITYYHIGAFIEMKGAAELIIPLVMVGLNVSMVMLNAVYERRKEIRTLSMLGLNPTHIGLIFVAEAIILGMVGGSLGYLLGLGFYRVMVLFGQELMVREKLEWWWSAIGFALALTASVLSSIRPAALAVSTYTPSKVKRLKLSEEKAKVRKEEIFKVYQGRELSMPVKVGLGEKEFFIGFFLDRLDELKTGTLESVDDVENVPEIENVKGELVKEIRFRYRFGGTGEERKTRNSLSLTKSPREDYYRVRLATEPAVPGTPASTIERTIDFVHDAIMDWTRNKNRIIGTL